MRKDATHTSSSRENQYYLLGRTRARCCDVTPLMRHTTYVGGKVLFCSVAHMWPLLTEQILELLSLIDLQFSTLEFAANYESKKLSFKPNCHFI